MEDYKLNSSGILPWLFKKASSFHAIYLAVPDLQLQPTGPSSCAVCLVAQSCLTLCDSWTVARQASLSMGILQATVLEDVAMPFSKGSSPPRDWTQISRIAGGFFTDWTTGQPRSTGVGSLALPQGIFPTQESTRGLLQALQADSLPAELWFPSQGSDPVPLHWERGVLTTGPPGKSPFHEVTKSSRVITITTSISPDKLCLLWSFHRWEHPLHSAVPACFTPYCHTDPGFIAWTGSHHLFWALYRIPWWEQTAMYLSFLQLSLHNLWAVNTNPHPSNPFPPTTHSFSF